MPHSKSLLGPMLAQLLLLSACPEVSTLNDAGPALDAGTLNIPDAGSSLDAGTLNIPDVGSSLDAGNLSFPDAGSSLDAGTLSFPDAGPALDAGRALDAGNTNIPDAGPILDAGPLPPALPGEVLIPEGALWRYWAQRDAPDANWRAADFDDAPWLSGATGIGYGDGDDETVLTDMSGNYITLYARASFEVANAASVTAFKLSVRVDDGFVAYLNGAEIGRFNMPAGEITHTTGASTSIDAYRAQEIIVPNPALVDGRNVLAVEIHNQSTNSSDLSFIPQVSIAFGPRPDFLQDYQEQNPAASIAFIPDNLSGITWNALSNTYFLIENGGGRVWEVTESFGLIRTLSSRGFGDAEDLVWLGGDEFAIVNESGRLFIGTFTAEQTSINADDFQEIIFAQPAGNVGPEGVAYDAQNRIFYVVKEKSPRRIYQFERPQESTDLTVVPLEPFDAELIFASYASDLSAVAFSASTGRLLVLSDEDNKVIDIGLDGFIYGEYELPEPSQWEGLTLNGREDLVVVGEPNRHISAQRP